MIHRGPELGFHPSDPAVDSLAEKTHGILTCLADEELVALIRQRLEEMGSDKREVLVLRLLEQKKNPEIANKLGLRPNTVAVRYRRALEELRESLPEVYRVVLREPEHW